MFWKFLNVPRTSSIDRTGPEVKPRLIGKSWNIFAVPGALPSGEYAKSVLGPIDSRRLRFISVMKDASVPGPFPTRWPVVAFMPVLSCTTDRGILFIIREK